MSFLSFARVGFASPDSADPIRTVLDGNILATDKGGAALGSSAGYLVAVLLAIAAPFLSVGYAPHLNTLSECSVFFAQASRNCFAGAAFDRAWLPGVVYAEASGMNGVGAPTNRAYLCGMLQTMSFLSFARVGFASPDSADPIRAVLDGNILAIDKGGAALGSSAGYLVAVLAAVAAPLQSVGCAPHFNTRAECSVFAAQASCNRFGGAAFHQARLPAVLGAAAVCTVLVAMAAPLQSVGCAPHFNTRAECSVFVAQASPRCFGGAAFHRA